MPTNSPKPRQGRPVESLELRISIRADRETAGRIREAIPSAVVKGGACELKIEARRPADMVEKARAVLEQLRAIETQRSG